MKMKSENKGTLLVTGLNSLIGWQLYMHLSKTYVTHGTYRKELPPFKAANCHRVDMERGPETKHLLERLQPDYLIHAWAICDLDLCEQMPELAERINVRGTRRLLRFSRKLKRLKKFVYISTDHVFNGERGGYVESDPPLPKHAYGRSKVRAEKFVRDSGLPAIIIRPGLVIGGSVQGNKGPRDWLLSRVRAGKPTHLFTDEWRSPISADEFTVRTAEILREGRPGTYHVAGDSAVNRFELGCMLAEKDGLPTAAIYPRLRREDRWAKIRPKNLSLKSEQREFLKDLV